MIVHSGIVKINTGAGDDLIVATSAGRVSINGGKGRDSISWATHTPSLKRNYSGVNVNLATGKVDGVGRQKLRSVENVIGSSFDDTIVGKPGARNTIYSGLGNGVLIYGNDGSDRVTVANSVPSFVTTTIDGGSGRNVLIGGRTKDVISTGNNSEGSIIKGGGDLDQIYVPGGGTALGGSASDVIHSQTPCQGGRVGGGPGDENLVFAGSPRGVKASIAGGYARHVRGKCRRSLKIGPDIESLEGSKYNDVLILGRKLRQQGRKRSLLGREGRDVLNSRNGVQVTVTTGAGGRKNKVIADRKDKV